MGRVLRKTEDEEGEAETDVEPKASAAAFGQNSGNNLDKLYHSVPSSAKYERGRKLRLQKAAVSWCFE